MSWMFAIYLLLLFPTGPASEENLILQEPTVIAAEEGESVNITCDFNHTDILGLFLRRTFVKNMKVLYLYAPGYGGNKTVDDEYKGRIEYFNLNKTVTIMLQQLRKNDSDKYICDGNVLIKQEPTPMQGRGTILVVTAKKPIQCSSSSSWMLYVLLVEAALLVTALGYFFLSHVDVKKYCQNGKGKEAQNVVYEDMTCSLRRNTVTNPYDC